MFMTGFIQLILCYLIKIDVGETKCKCLSSTIPHISKNDRLFCCSQRLKSIANNRIDANLMIKQYTVFGYLHQLSQNIGSNTFIRIYSSHFAQENLQGKAQRMHTPYADSDVVQNFCVNSAFRYGVHVKNMQLKKSIFCMQYCKPR